MPDQRSVMKEYRYLDEKRVAEGLTPEEEARYARLRDLVGPELGTGGIAPRPGFDVNAAAARLRESLLPAGLRNPPPSTPEPAPEEPSAAAAFAELHAAQPLETIELQPEPYDPAADGYATGSVPPDEGAAAYDPGAQPYVPDAQSGWDASYDPGAPPSDPNALPFDPGAQLLDPNAQPYDPGAQQAWDTAYDPGAPPADPNALTFDPGAQLLDANAQPYDPGAQQAWDAAYDLGAPPADPNALTFDPGVQLLDPNAQADAPIAEPGVDHGYDPSALLGAPGQEPEPLAAGFDAEAPAEQPPLDVEATPLPPTGWDTSPPSPEPPPPGSELGEYDADAAGFAPLDLGGTEALPFEAADAGAVPPSDDQVQGYAAPLGEYDDTAGFEVPPADVPSDAPALDGELPRPHESQEASLEDGFRLASEGSFGGAADAAAPEWAAGPAAPPWDSVPPLDVDAVAGEPTAPAAEYEIATAPGDDLGALDLHRLDPSAEEPVLTEAAAPAADADPLEVAVDAVAAETAFAAASARELAADAYPVDAAFEGSGGEPPGAVEEGAGPELELGASPQPEPPLPSEPEPAVALEPVPQAPPDAALDFSFDVDTEEEIPTVDGADILEVIPEEGAEPPPRPLDFEPLVEPPASSEPQPADPEAFVPPEPPAAAQPEPEVAAAADAEVAVQPEPPAWAAPPREAAPAAPPAIAPAANAAAAIAATARAAVPAPAPAPASSPAVPASGASSRVPGAHRVVVHTVEGQVKRGALHDADLSAPSLSLAVQPGGGEESVPTEKVKAIFFMLAPGEKAPAPEGKKVRVTFRDGRQVAGFSPDYDEGRAGFFMIPGDTRTNTGRIWVYRAAVRQVALS